MPDRLRNLFIRLTQGPNDPRGDILGEYGAPSFTGFVSPVFNVLAMPGDLAATGDGVTNDAPAINGLIGRLSTLGGGTIFFPRGAGKTPNRYLIASSLGVIGNNITFQSDGAVLVKGFNGDIFTIGSGSENVKFFNLNIDGQGATFTGRGLVVPGGFDRNVQWIGGDILDMAGPCIEFGANGGEMSLVAFCRLGIFGATGATSDEPAIKHNATDTLKTVRKFQSVHCMDFTRLYHDTPPGAQTGGGGHIADCYTGGITLNANTLGLIIEGCRFAFDSIIDGVAVNIACCNFGSACTINSGFNASRFKGCLVAGTFTDSSFVGNSDIDPPATNLRYRAYSGIAERKVVLTDAATILVDARLGNLHTVTLGGNRTMGAPSGPTDGQRITFIITQDGTGGRTLAWNAAYRHAWVDTGNTLGRFSTIAFRYDAVIAQWRQEGPQLQYIAP